MNSTRPLGSEILRFITDVYMDSAQNSTADDIAKALGVPVGEVLTYMQRIPFGVVVDGSGNTFTYGPSRECIRSELLIATRQTATARAVLKDANEEIERLREENQSLRSAAGDSIRGRIDLGMRP